MIAIFAGLSLGLSLIISLGPQNLFLIRQGLHHEYAYTSAAICFVCDSLLIAGSCLGVGHAALQYPVFKNVLMIFGIGFLTLYGAKSIYTGIRQLWSAKSTNVTTQNKQITLLSVILMALSMSLFNPQAIFDSLVMVGSVASLYSDNQHWQFMLGAILASLLWFYSLIIATRYLGDYLRRPVPWAVIEMLSGVVMVFYAVKLL